jgi:phosphate-selective porin
MALSSDEEGDQSDASKTQPDQPASGQPPAEAKQESKKKAKKKGKGTGGSDEKPKPPKHPSWTPVAGVTIDFKARIESELRASTPASGFESGQIEWQDRRIGVEGTAFKRFTFEISRELGDDFESAHDLSEKTRWRDVYGNWRVTRALNLQAGRFKIPFGREELMGEPNLDFVHRSLAARVLSPGRDAGVMAHGRLFSRRVGYQAGYFTRDGDNGRTSETQGGGGAFAARLVVAPFAFLENSALAPVEIGVATEDSHVDNRLGLRGRTVLGDGIFFDRLYVNGQRRRLGLDAAWENGPRSLSAEYIMVSDERKAMGFDGADLANIDARAWYVAGTWALTGERKHGRLEPRKDLLQGGFGAVEVAARVEELRFGNASYPSSTFGFPTAEDLSTNADHAITLGINWYLNHYVKLQGNVVVEWIQDPQRSPAPSSDGRFISPVLMVQFRF